MTPEQSYRERTEATLATAGIVGARFAGGLWWRLNVEDLELSLLVADALHFRASTVVVGTIQALPAFPSGVAVTVGDRGTLGVSAERYFDAAPEMMRPMVDRVVAAAKAIRRPASGVTWVEADPKQRGMN